MRVEVKIDFIVFLWLVLAGALIAQPAWADKTEESIKVLMRVVSYQKTEVDGSEYKVAVVYDQSVPSDELSAVLDGIRKSGNIKISGRRIAAQELLFKKVAELKEKLKQTKANAVFLVAGMREDNISKILGVGRQLKVLSIAGDSDYVNKSGATLGVSNVGGKYKILINRKGCALEGVTFDTRLLRMAVY